MSHEDLHDVYRATMLRLLPDKRIVDEIVSAVQQIVSGEGTEYFFNTEDDDDDPGPPTATLVSELENGLFQLTVQLCMVVGAEKTWAWLEHIIHGLKHLDDSEE